MPSIALSQTSENENTSKEEANLSVSKTDQHPDPSYDDIDLDDSTLSIHGPALNSEDIQEFTKILSNLEETIK